MNIKKTLPTPNQMLTLIKFVDAGSFGEAFGGGRSEQAAATQQLGRIDACMGVKTRKRVGGVKQPTDEARELARHFRMFVTQLENFRTETGQRPNTFSIGAGDTLSFYVLLPALKRTGSWRGEVELRLLNLRTQEILSGLLDGSLDIGLVRSSALKASASKALFKQWRVGRLEYAFFLNKSLLDGYTGSLTDDQQLLSWCSTHVPLATFWGERSTFSDALSKVKLDWPTHLRCESFPQVAAAVSAGGTAAFCPS